MARSMRKDAQALFHSLRSAYTATPTTLKVIDLYVGFAVFTALIQVSYRTIYHKEVKLFCALLNAQGRRRRGHGTFCPMQDSGCFR